MGGEVVAHLLCGGSVHLTLIHRGRNLDPALRGALCNGRVLYGMCALTMYGPYTIRHMPEVQTSFRSRLAPLQWLRCCVLATAVKGGAVWCAPPDIGIVSIPHTVRGAPDIFPRLASD